MPHKAKGCAIVSDNRPEGFFQSRMFAEQLVFICATVSKRQSFQRKFPVKCFFALHVAGLFVEVLQGEVVYFWGNFAL